MYTSTMKKSHKNTNRGKTAFEETYKDYLQALKQTSLPILRFHPKNEKILKELWRSSSLPLATLKWYPYALKWPGKVPPKTDLPGNNEHLFYLQNASSLLPVFALDIKPGQKVLDAAAAPGGKALFIAEKLESTGEFIVNDLSNIRLNRLKRVFEERDIKKNFPKYLRQNAAILFKKYPNYFDRILLDAPCSSEKHIYSSQEHLKNWTNSRIRHLKQIQLSLINGLFLALKKGGRMVYSTCSINREENEEVIEKFLKKYKGSIKIIPLPKTFPGYQSNSPYIYIDIRKPENANLDPMFVAIIEKTAETEVKRPEDNGL